MNDGDKTKEQLLKELSTLKVRLAEADVLEAELRSSREKLAAMEQIVGSMHVGVTLSDIAGRILYTNPAEAAMHGYAVDELIGKEVRVFAPDGIWNPLTKQQVRKLKRLTREGINVRKDGTTIRVLLTSDVVKNQQGEPVAIITTSEEITARKQAEDVMAAMFKLAERTAMAATPGGCWRTPIPSSAGWSTPATSSWPATTRSPTPSATPTSSTSSRRPPARRRCDGGWSSRCCAAARPCSPPRRRWSRSCAAAASTAWRRHSSTGWACRSCGGRGPSACWASRATPTTSSSASWRSAC
ncbi:PAS domain S-box protein [bacterium]|nr:PAS domain S-box protein [bacterium]